MIGEKKVKYIYKANNGELRFTLVIVMIIFQTSLESAIFEANR